MIKVNRSNSLSILSTYSLLSAAFTLGLNDKHYYHETFGPITITAIVETQV